MISNLDQAAEQLAKAASLEKQAKKFRADARTFVLDYYNGHREEFPVAPDSDSGKTVQKTTPAGTIRITTPRSPDLPSRFDASRTDEFHELLSDTMPGFEDLVFEPHYTLRQDWLEVIINLSNEERRRFAGLMEKFVLPETRGTDLAPRVEVK